MTESGRSACEVVLVDDDEGDRELIRLAFEECTPLPVITPFDNGAEALAYLGQAAQKRPRPCILVLLDLNMPGLDGRDVLRRIKADPSTVTFPVVVLTTSDSERDVVECYASHANAFLTKPNELSQYRTMARRLCDFWFSTVRLPI
jgi:chemotaxis family two-component system response regulator Rcp1